MDIKYPLYKLFGEKNHDTVDVDKDTAARPDDFRVPPALNAIAAAYFDLINHTYGLTYVLVFPGGSATLDDDTVYALTFRDRDAPDTEKARLGQFLDDIVGIDHFMVNREEQYLYAESLTDLVLGYRALAEKKKIILELPAPNETDIPGAELEKSYMQALCARPHTLLFLHDTAQYLGRSHLVAHYRSSAGADDRHMTPYYSYRDLLRIAGEYDLCRDLKCVHVPVWQN